AATSIEVVGGLMAMGIPLIAVILFVVLPATVYETVLNFYFLGDTFVQVIGMLLYMGGGALLIWSARHLGKFDIGKVAVAEDHVLVETGPYARVGHPSYTDQSLIALAVSFILLNAVLFVNVVVAAGFYFQRARLEEKLLSSEDGFGEQYLSYMSQTGRFFPRLSSSVK
ncbi:MAG: methyltransferase family protein, partial [Candidatus Thorarchaeota archaeon]